MINLTLSLQITDETDVMIDHVIIHSSSFVGAALCVKKQQANPRLRVNKFE
jgi:hypothetical protein